MNLTTALSQMERTERPSLPISTDQIEAVIEGMDDGGDWSPYGHDPAQDRLAVRSSAQGTGYEVFDKWSRRGAIVARIEPRRCGPMGLGFRGQLAAGDGTRAVEGETLGEVLAGLEHEVDRLQAV